MTQFNLNLTRKQIDRVSVPSPIVIDTALLPIIAAYQLSPPGNKMFIFQLWLYILKAFCCVFVPFTLEIALPYLLDLGCYFGEVIVKYP